MNSILDYYKRSEIPTLILCTPSLSPVFSLGAAYNVTSTQRFMDQSALEFDFPKSIDNGKSELPAYSKIQTKMVVKLEGVGNYIISECPESSAGNVPVKHVSAKSLEYELIFKRITALAGTFKFYDSVLPANTIMARILELSPGWSLGYIDEDLVPLWRTFDVGTNSVYNFITSDVAKAFSCVFKFDSVNKTISAYAIKNLENETGIYISQNNIGNSITLTQYSDEITTALHCYGGTDLDIRRVNPLGGNIIYNFDYFINDAENKWMSDSLKLSLASWRMKELSKAQIYSETSLAFNTKYKDKVEIEQAIKDTKSSLSALQTTLEGLNASPTDGLSPELLLERQNKIDQCILDIANIKLSIRALRQRNSICSAELDKLLSIMKTIVYSLKFTGKEAWKSFMEDCEIISKNIKYISDNWGTIYFETADEEELDIFQLNSDAQEINQLCSSALSYSNDLWLDVSAKELSYWSMEIGSIESVVNRITFVLNALNELSNRLNALISNTDIVISINSNIETLYNYSEIIGLETNLTKQEFDELQSFIFYNTYTNNNIIITDTMTEKEIQDWSKELYDQGVENLSRACYPRYELSGDFISIISNPLFSDFVDKIDLGKQVTVELPGGGIIEGVTLLEISYTYDNPDSFSMTFSNKVKLNNSNFVFADMFIDGISGNSGVSGITGGQSSKGGAITSSDSIAGNNILSVTNALISKLGYISFGPTPPTEYGNYVGSWLGYNKGAKFSLYSSPNDYLQWDGSKLLVKARNFTLDSAGNITANNATLQGKISAASGDIGGWKIEPEQLSSTTGNFVLNSSAPRLTLGDASGSMIGQGVFIGQSTGSYVFRVGDPIGDYFAWDKDGIHISGDWIAGWEITENALYSGTGSSTVTINSLPTNNTVDIPAFSAGGSFVEYINPQEKISEIESIPFRVYHDGRLFATNATISGSIIATSGSIGGWSVTSTCIVDSSGSVGLSSEVTEGNDIRFWAGSTDPSSAPFKVYENGDIYAENADISGSIIATVVEAASGSIGGWIISASYLYSGSGNNYVELNSGTGSPAIMAGGSTIEDANFIVYKDGSIFASSASITGSIIALAGEIGGWSVTSTCIVDSSGSVGLSSQITGGNDIRFWAGSADPSSAPFSVDNFGNIRAEYGKIANWYILPYMLTNDSYYVGIRNKGTSGSEIRFWAGGTAVDNEGEVISTPEFYVTEDGSLYASSANIKGNITAETGFIANWVISDNTLVSTDGKVGLSTNDAGGDPIRFWAGDAYEYYEDAPFRITSSGSVYASAGDIGGWLISASSLTNHLPETNRVGLSSGTGIAFYAGSESPSSANFRVETNGNLYASNADITGHVNANSGTIGGWEITNMSIEKNDIELNSNDGTINVGSGYDKIVIDGPNSQIKSGNYTSSQSGFSISGTSGNAEFNDILARGEIRSSVFSFDEITAAAGTLGVYKSAGILKYELNTNTDSGSFILPVKEPAEGIPTAPFFADGDILRLKKITVNGNGEIVKPDDDGYTTWVADNWLVVNSSASAISPEGKTYYEYSCSLKHGTPAIFQAGQAIIDYGNCVADKGGHLIMTATHFSESGNTVIEGPYYSVNSSTSGSPWNYGFDQHVRLGNLKGSYDYPQNGCPVYGIGIGTIDGNHLLYDPDNGMRIRGSIEITGGNTRRIITASGIDYAPENGNNDGDLLIDSVTGLTYEWKSPGEWKELVNQAISGSINALNAEILEFSDDSVISPFEKKQTLDRINYIASANYLNLFGATYTSFVSGCGTYSGSSFYQIDELMTEISGSYSNAYGIITTGSPYIICSTEPEVAYSFPDSDYTKDNWDADWNNYYTQEAKLINGLSIMQQFPKFSDINGIMTPLLKEGAAGSGLYLTPEFIGFYNINLEGDIKYRSYIDKYGNFSFGGDISAGKTGLAWVLGDNDVYSSGSLKIGNADINMYRNMGTTSTATLNLSPGDSSTGAHIAIGSNANSMEYWKDDSNGTWIGEKWDGEAYIPMFRIGKISSGSLSKGISYNGDNIDIVGADIKLGNSYNDPNIRIHPGGKIVSGCITVPYISIGEPAPTSFSGSEIGIFMGRDTQSPLEVLASSSTISGCIISTGSVGAGSLIGMLVQTPKYTFRVGSFDESPHILWDGINLDISTNSLEITGSMSATGGINIGGSADPGNGNLLVSGTTTLGTIQGAASANGTTIFVNRTPGSPSFKSTDKYFILESASNGSMVLNYWGSTNVSIAGGGGKATIGTNNFSSANKLYVNGNTSIGAATAAPTNGLYVAGQVNLNSTLNVSGSASINGGAQDSRFGLSIAGNTSASTSYALVVRDSGNTDNFYVRDDGQVFIPKGGVAVGSTTAPGPGNLTISGTTIATGLITANGGITVPSGATITGLSHTSLGDLTTGDPHTQYVKGAGTVTDNAIVRFNGTGGRTIQNSTSVTIDDLNQVLIKTTGYCGLTVWGNTTASGSYIFIGRDNAGVSKFLVNNVGDVSISGSLTVTGSLSSGNISATPTNSYIPKAGTDGKLATGWIPDISSIYNYSLTSHNHDSTYLGLGASWFEMGSTRSGSGYACIDFHSNIDTGNGLPDYDARIISSVGGGGGASGSVAGTGDLSLYGRYINFNGTLVAADAIVPRTISVRLAGDTETLTNKTYWTAYLVPTILNGRTITRVKAGVSDISSGSTTVTVTAWNSSLGATGIAATATISANSYISNTPTISGTYKYLAQDNFIRVDVATSGSQIAKGVILNIEVY